MSAPEYWRAICSRWVKAQAAASRTYSSCAVNPAASSAADAIATIGSGAATAVPQLIEACDRPGEHVHVLRSVAKALGNTGGAAAPAIPALEKLERIPRVEWPAREAITKITAKTSGQAR